MTTDLRDPSLFSPHLANSECVFHGMRFDVRTTTIKGRSGRDSQLDAVIHPGSVVILPILDDGRILMIKNERHLIGKTLWELPAGTLEDGEGPDRTAEREVEEETGYRAKTLEHLLSFYPTPGICTELMHAYLAKDLEPTKQALDDTEIISVEAVTWTQAFELIQMNAILDAKTLLLLLYCKEMGYL